MGGVGTGVAAGVAAGVGDGALVVMGGGEALGLDTVVGLGWTVEASGIPGGADVWGLAPPAEAQPAPPTATATATIATLAIEAELRQRARGRRTTRW